MSQQAYALGVKMALQQVSLDDAKRIGREIGVNWDEAGFPPEQLRKGIEVEQEHGSEFGEETNVGGDNLQTAARIAWVHLKELGDYYTRLEKMEKGA